MKNRAFNYQKLDYRRTLIAGLLVIAISGASLATNSLSGASVEPPTANATDVSEPTNISSLTTQAANALKNGTVSATDQPTTPANDQSNSTDTTAPSTIPSQNRSSATCNTTQKNEFDSEYNDAQNEESVTYSKNSDAIANGTYNSDADRTTAQQNEDARHAKQMGFINNAYNILLSYFNCN